MWTDVRFNEVSFEDPLLPEGEYAFRVRYAKRDKYDPERISVSLAVAGDKHEGEAVYLTFPNPVKAGKGVPATDDRNWVVKEVARFLSAIEAKPGPGEHPIDAINRAAKEKERYIVARVKHRTYTSNGETKTAIGFVYRSVRPATVVKEEKQ